MRQAKNVITPRAASRRLKAGLILYVFLLLLEFFLTWSYLSFVHANPDSERFLRLGVWILNPFSTPLVPLAELSAQLIPLILKLYALTTIISLLLLIPYGRRTNFRSIEEGSAHFAFRKELKLFRERANFQPLAEKVFMTKAADLPNDNVLCVASPGEGKSFAVLTPGIIQACRPGYEKPTLIITDTKGALYRDTSKMVRDAGYEVRMLNLTNPRFSELYNPLENLHQEKLYTEISTLAKCFVQNTRDPEAKTGDAFWEDSLQFLLTSVWAYQATFPENPVTRGTETRAMYRTLELIRGIHLTSEGTLDGSCEFVKIIAAIRETSPLHLSVTSYDSFAVAAPETLQSIVVTATSRLAVFGQPDIELLTMHDEMRLDEAFEKPTALYLNFEVGSSFRPVAALFLEQCFSTAYYLAESRFGGRLDRKCIFMLDEIATICKFTSLPERLSTARSYNISIMLFVQALQQLKHLYDGSDQTIINNCAVFAFLGNSEPDTLKRVSETLLGKTTVDETNQNRGEKGGSETDHRKGRELMTPDELHAMPRKKCILIMRGHHPIYANKCQTQNWKEYALLGGQGNPQNSADIRAEYILKLNGHYETYRLIMANRTAAKQAAAEEARSGMEVPYIEITELPKTAQDRARAKLIDRFTALSDRLKNGGRLVTKDDKKAYGATLDELEQLLSRAVLDTTLNGATAGTLVPRQDDDTEEAFGGTKTMPEQVQKVEHLQNEIKADEPSVAEEPSKVEEQKEQEEPIQPNRYMRI